MSHLNHYNNQIWSICCHHYLHYNCSNDINSCIDSYFCSHICIDSHFLSSKSYEIRIIGQELCKKKKDDNRNGQSDGWQKDPITDTDKIMIIFGKIEIKQDI